jgi:hypothetical protein
MRDPFNCVARTDPALLQHAQIKAGAIGRGEAGGELIVIHADAELEARRARLRDLHPRRADLKLIADADRVFQPAGDGEILAELAVWKTFALRTPLTLSPALVCPSTWYIVTVRA